MSRAARLVILGRQGAGKGTQAVRLSRCYAVPHLATGDIFRAAVRSGSELGRTAKAYLDAGELVPDKIVIGMVAERLTRGLVSRGFVLDGFPRTIVQAEVLDEILKPDGIDRAIELQVDTRQVLSRLASRRVCSDCGANYNLLDNPPRLTGTCDICGADLIQRDDDTEGAIRRRLALYERETAPLTKWFADRDLLATVDGTGSPDQVTRRLIEVVDQPLRRHSSYPEPAAATASPARTRPV